MCGEQLSYSSSYVVMKGSPPRVRGTAAFPFDLGIYKRITPACAGNSQARDRYSDYSWDHPRVCGEQSHPPGAKAVI